MNDNPYNISIEKLMFLSAKTIVIRGFNNQNIALAFQALGWQRYPKDCCKHGDRYLGFSHSPWTQIHITDLIQSRVT